jgi:hypothetical protein
MSGNGFILECDFQFRCPKEWDSLTQSPDPTVRFCSVCQQNVHFVTTRKQFEVHRRLNHCIAASVHIEALDKFVTVAGGDAALVAKNIHLIGDQENVDELGIAIDKVQSAAQRKRDSEDSV